MSHLNCCYAEDCRFDSFFGWIRSTQHCVCNKWLPTCGWLQSSVSLQSCSNLQSQNWTESCEEFQKKIINSNPILLKQKWQHPDPSMYWNVARFRSKDMFISGHFHVLGMRTPHFQCHINREVATTSPRFCNDPHLLHVPFVKVVPGTTFTCWSKHQFVANGKAGQQVSKASHCHIKQQ